MLADIKIIICQIKNLQILQKKINNQSIWKKISKVLPVTPKIFLCIFHILALFNGNYYHAFRTNNLLNRVKDN